MFDNMPGHIWIDGRIVPWVEARVHIMTHSLHYASSIFEGLRTYDGKVFKSLEHYQRLHTSAGYMGYKIPYTATELVHATEQIVELGGYKQGYVRALVWIGSQKMTVSHDGTDVHTAIGIWERPPIHVERYFTEGMRLTVADWRRPDPRTAPVHSKAACLYGISAISKRASELAGYDDALMLDCEDNIAEASSSNIFFVGNGKLYTPRPDCFLNGITRLTCIEIARSLGIEVCETKIKWEDLGTMQEAFLTGTAIEILPVGSVDGFGKTWRFKPGELTNRIRGQFMKCIDNL
ncbi:MAG: aminotransferase class IV [Bacillota bacterium]